VKKVYPTLVVVFCDPPSTTTLLQSLEAKEKPSNSVAALQFRAESVGVLPSRHKSVRVENWTKVRKKPFIPIGSPMSGEVNTQGNARKESNENLKNSRNSGLFR